MLKGLYLKVEKYSSNSKALHVYELSYISGPTGLIDMLHVKYRDSTIRLFYMPHLKGKALLSFASSEQTTRRLAQGDRQMRPNWTCLALMANSVCSLLSSAVDADDSFFLSPQDLLTL